MKRGDVVTMRESGSPSSKARPGIIASRSSVLDVAVKITVCPLTLKLRGTIGQRPFVAPSATNGLRLPSEVQVDWIYTHPLERMGEIIGFVDAPTLEQIDIMLRRWLDL